MSYLQQAFKPKNEFWMYMIGSLLIIVGSFVGQIPFTIAALYKINKNGGSLYNIDESKIMTILEPNLGLALVLLSFVFGLLVLFILVKIWHKQTITQLTTSRPKIDWKRVMFSFLFWGIISSGMIGLDYYFSPENYEWNFKLNQFLILCGVAVVLIPIQTSCEEYVFRGYLMQGFGLLAKNKWFPLVLTSLIFGLLHIANPEIDKLGYSLMIYYIGTGLFLGIITLMDEGLELALGFHAANNLMTALLVTADWTAFQTHSLLKDTSDPELGLAEICIPVFVLFPIILFIFSKVYKWKNWKEKLTGKLVPLTDDNIQSIGDEF